MNGPLVNLGAKEAGSKEIRYIGDCPWCDSLAVSLRDYMCYDPIKPCCYSLYHKLQPKIHAAVRCFPNRTLNVATQFDELVGHFHKCIIDDKRMMKEIEERWTIVENTLAEYNSDIMELLRFLARLYIVRRVLQLKNDEDFVNMQCLVCARELSEDYRREICPSCMEAIGKPPDTAEASKPGAPAPQQKQPRMGMHVRRR